MDDALIILIDKYLINEATEEERKIVDAWYSSFESRPGFTEQLGAEEQAKAMTESFLAFSKKIDSTNADFKQGVV